VYTKSSILNEKIYFSPFYGFHEKQHQFFKIYLFNPNLIKKTADLLLNGTILGRTFQPHESHIPFTQQFMVDYNLQGMHLVHCANMTYRRDPLLELDGPVNREELEIPAKVSTCEIEADILAEEILNRYDNYTSRISSISYSN
jgi:DNA polymerase zeta